MKGDTVYEEEEPLPRHMYVIVSGAVNLVQRSTRRTLDQLVSGDHFGEGGVPASGVVACTCCCRADGL